MVKTVFPQFPQTKRIWLDAKTEKNSYAEFQTEFFCTGETPLTLQIACDSIYAVWLNGVLVGFSGCGDYPWYKLYDSICLTGKSGSNALLIAVWYCGEDSQTYLTAEPGLMFELTRGNELLAYSARETRSRRMPQYRSEVNRITSQLGLSFCYDSTLENTLPYRESAEFAPWPTLVRRSAQLQLLPRQRAGVQKTDDGYLIDLGEETVGFLELAFDSTEAQTLTVAYGEHLKDGAVPRIIGERDFSVQYIARPGENHYLNPFRRLAGRYLQLFCEKELQLHYAGLRPVEYPVKQKPHFFPDAVNQRIYDVSVNTLKKCMHEHYEDCPWREQAMYVLDSRNQMLCGYEAFEGHDYQRQQILMMAQGQRSDGALPLCFPAGLDFPIPFFSLAYLKILDDYTAYTGDVSVLDEVADCVHRLMSSFTARVEPNGLLPNLPYPFWNFYEWTQNSFNGQDMERTKDTPYIRQYDLILNAMYVHAVGIYNRLYGRKLNTEKTVRAIQETFYDADAGCYKLSTAGTHYSVLGNSMALLIGLGDEALARRLLTDQTLTPVTLSMNTFFYDALLSFGDTFRDALLTDLRRKYTMMLEEGATTFWETENGWHDFGDAGSLCHGWSAIPVFYLKKLL